MVIEAHVRYVRRRPGTSLARVLGRRGCRIRRDYANNIVVGPEIAGDAGTHGNIDDVVSEIAVVRHFGRLGIRLDRGL